MQACLSLRLIVVLAFDLAAGMQNMHRHENHACMACHVRKQRAEAGSRNFKFRIPLSLSAQRCLLRGHDKSRPYSG